MRARRNTWLLAVALFAGAVPAAASAQDAQEARAALVEGRYDDALDAYERLVRDNAGPAVARGYVRALAEVGRYEEAIRSAGAGPELANVRGETLRAVGRTDEAKAAFEEAVDGGASDRNAALANLGVLLWNRGERDEARAIFDSFIDLYNGSARLDSEELMAVGTAVRYLGLEEYVLFQDALLAFDQATEVAPDDPRPHILAGQLFLEKYNSPDAHASFNEVLVRNPLQPDALLGEARALDFDGQGGAMDLVDRALETNPNHVDALAFRAGLLLKTEEHDQARREAERALAVNPNHLGALSVLAAAHYLSGDQAAFADTRERVLAVDPMHADLFVTVATLAADQRRYADAVELGRRATELDSTSWRGWAVLGMNQLRTGEIPQGRTSLERAFEGDPYNVWVKNSLDLLDTFDEYETVRTDHFELFLRGDEADLLQIYAGPLAEEAYAALRERYGIDPPTPIRVEVFPSHADFSVRTLGEAGLGALGVAFGSTLVMDSPAARDRGEFNWESTFWHELSHAFHLAMTEHRVPRWFSEGLAVHEQRAARERWGFQVSGPWLQAFQAGRLEPVSSLNEGFVRPEYPEQVIFSYYQASLVFDLIRDRWGFDAILEMLRGYRDGRTTEELFVEVLGMDPEEVDETFDGYVRERFGDRLAAVEPITDELIPGESLADLRQRVQRHPRSFPTRLALGKALFEEGSENEAEAEFREALRLFPEYGGPDGPYWYLARIHQNRGELQEAAESFYELGLRNEVLVVAHLEEAEVRAQLGEPQAAAAALQRAVEVFPYDVESHDRLAELYESLGQFDGAVRERRAILALNPVDRAEAHFRLATALARAGDRASARSEVLRALEIAPNYDAALDLLLELRGEGG